MSAAWLSAAGAGSRIDVRRSVRTSSFRRGLRAIALLLTGVAFATHSAPLQAQSVRGWVGSSLRYIQMRPLVPDTGAVLSPGALAHATITSQDLSLTAWGFGVEGLSFTTFLRTRSQLGGAFDWPRTEDHFDALLGYFELYRRQWRLRVGRQNTTSALGFASYDGAELTLTPSPSVRLAAFGGRSLARGLAEPRNEALRGLQDFVPDDQAYLVGGSVRLQTHYGTSVDFRYQREAWSEGHHLLSERGSVAWRTSLLRPLQFSGSADYDFGMGGLGKVSGSLLYPADGRWSIEVRGRRYVPYFDLSTIWGFFSPVPYTEVGVEGRIAIRPGVATWVCGGWRSYEAAETTVVLRPLESDALRAHAGFDWRWSEAWRGSGTYRLEWAAGAYLNSADLRLTRNVGSVALTTFGSVFQQIEEFRLGDLLVVGAGASASASLGGRTHLDGGLVRYSSRDRERDDPFDFSPTRAWLSLRVDVGRDPGLTGGRQ